MGHRPTGLDGELPFGRRHPRPTLDRRTAHRWVQAIGQRAGLDAVHPHILRAGFIMAALDAGVPLRDQFGSVEAEYDDKGVVDRPHLLRGEPAHATSEPMRVDRAELLDQHSRPITGDTPRLHQRGDGAHLAAIVVVGLERSNLGCGLAASAHPLSGGEQR